MINDALHIIVGLINDYIGVIPDEVSLGNISLIDAYQDTSATELSEKVIASVVNIEQESTLRNLPYRKTVTGDDGMPKGVQQSPKIYLNIYVLFGANKSPANYDTALRRISQIIGFFQRNHTFTPENTPPLAPTGIHKLIFDLYSTSFEELNHLWSVNGGKYIPSVLYKMRMIAIQDAEAIDSGIIKSLGTTPNVI